ncbi:MAG: dipeptide/oligopeptide/nickel ABC transporter ATP-binding protein [Lachnospiraceae bacterium]|nr:dipeptide/oligopeptide/nickel ABC transporter ATP-binding protein [Lachnospiraceae bacterium]
METILQVKDLTKIFKKGGHKELCAVDHVSFEVKEGEILGIVGESGSGKSTIAQMLLRLTDVSSGQILLEGQDITRLKGRRLAEVYDRVQMVFQTPAGSFDPRRTLGDGICESLKNKGVSRQEREKKAGMLLEQCGLSADFLKRYPHEVSGGQCQRAAIARALMPDPKLLILDEATSALDVTVQKQILELLEGLHRERQISYLLICHNLALVQQICDRVLVLGNGRVEEEGTPDQVIWHPQSDYARALVQAAF